MADPQQILVAGDWHGSVDWALDIIRRLPTLLPHESPRLILHCGDFGIWPGTAGERFLYKLNRELELVNGSILFVDGNHDATPVLDRLPQQGGRGRTSDRIWHLPRGHRWQWHSRTWAAVGGGVSLDRVARTEGRNWWPGEEISDDQEKHIIAGGPVDVMVSHDRPSSVIHTFPDRPAWWDQADVDRSERHEERLQRIADALQPAHLMHGHLHRAYARTVRMSHGDVHVTGFDCDGSERGNWAVLNVETLEWGISHA